MKVLVTGGAGLVGSEIVRQLKKRKIETYATDIKRKEGVDYLDVTLLGKIIDYLRTRKFGSGDAIIHMAGKVAGVPSLKDPWGYFYVNMIGILNILEAMRTLGLKYLVFPSSWSTLGSKISLPITEKTPLHPENPYGASKKVCEALIELYTKKYGIKSVVLRPTMIYGPEQEEKNVVQHIVDCMISGSKMTIFGRGEHTRELLHVRDAARIFIEALKIVKKVKGMEVFILGTERPITISELAKIGKRIKKFPVIYSKETTWAFSQRSNMTKLKKVFGIDTKDFIPIEEGLKECLKSRSK